MNVVVIGHHLYFLILVCSDMTSDKGYETNALTCSNGHQVILLFNLDPRLFMFSTYGSIHSHIRSELPGSGRCRHSSRWSSGLGGWPCTAASRSGSDTRWQPAASSHLSSAGEHHMRAVSSPYGILGFSHRAGKSPTVWLQMHTISCK